MPACMRVAGVGGGVSCTVHEAGKLIVADVCLIYIFSGQLIYSNWIIAISKN